jgi:ABC-type glycerol-3-phosphate transport system permease component
MTWLVLGSLKSNVEIFGSPWQLPSDPVGNGIANFTRSWTNLHLGTYLLNSVTVTAASVVLNLAVATPAAYALARVRFRANIAVQYYFIAGMGLPYQLIAIPLVVLLADIHLIDTLPGLILTYSAVGIPFSVLLLTGFFRSLPRDLEDAAAIDGASPFQVFLRIMLPISLAGVGTAAVFQVVEVWNEFFLALLIIRTGAQRTLPLGVYAIKEAMTTSADWAALFVSIVVVILPTTCIFIFLSDRMMRGLSLSAGR